MPQIRPPDQGRVESRALQAWHAVYKPSWETLIALGYASGASTHTYALNIEGLGALSGEVSMFGGGFATPEMQTWPTGATASYYIVSDSTDDTSDATIYGIDASGEMAMVTVTLTGTTPVSLGTFKHINAVMYTNGGARNVGSIYVSTDAAGVPTGIVADNIAVIIPPRWAKGVNPTMMSSNREVMVFPEINISADRADGATISIYKGTADGDVFKVAQFYLFQSVFQNHFGVPIIINPGQFIRLTVERSPSGTGDINAACDLRHYGISALTLPNATDAFSVLTG